MIVYSQKPEEQYYEAVSGKGPTLVVFGEQGEHWTSSTIEFFERRKTVLHFFPWSKIPEVRLQLGLSRYPVVQIWRNGSCAAETTGYDEEALEGVVALLQKGKIV